MASKRVGAQAASSAAKMGSQAASGAAKMAGKIKMAPTGLVKAAMSRWVIVRAWAEKVGEHSSIDPVVQLVMRRCAKHVRPATPEPDIRNLKSEI